VIALVNSANSQLADKLSDEQRKKLQSRLRIAKAEQLALDREETERLLPRLLSSDARSRAEAEVPWKAMGDRVRRPLIEKLRETLTTDPLDVEREKAILDLLRRLDPSHAEYDFDADRAKRLEKTEQWLREVP
jgi:hypothetical protein